MLILDKKKLLRYSRGY